MSDFINTIDVLGDDAAVDSVITKSVTEFYDNVVTKIGRGVFYKCSSLTTVNLPAVTSVGSGAFYGCDALINVNLPLATTIGGTAFDNVDSLTRITLPSATSIDSQAFRACTALNTVELNSKTSIDEYAFNNASALKVLALRSTAGASTLSYTNAFNGTPIASGTGYIYVPSSLLSSYKTASNWSTYADQFRKLEEWTVNGTVTGELDVDNRCMVRFFNDDGTLLGYKVVAKGSDAVWDDTPVCSEDASWPFLGFAPEPTNVTEDTDCYAQYQMPYDLEAASWAEISEISASGDAANYISVGDTKSVALNGTVGTLNLDATYYVYVLGINHNSEVEGTGIQFGGFKTNAGAGGIDICLCDSKYSSPNENGTKYFNFNHWGNSNYGGWKRCDIRYDILGSTNVSPDGYGAQAKTGQVGHDATNTCATNPVEGTLMSCLPADLRAVMKPITKYSDNVGGGTDTETNVKASVDYLPLLSEFEVSGTRKYANSCERNYQKQYDYFAAGNGMTKYRHDATNSSAFWLTRSIRSTNNNEGVTISLFGSVGTGGCWYSGGVSPAFMV